MLLPIKALVWELLVKNRVGLIVSFIVIPFLWYVIESYILPRVGLNIIDWWKLDFGIMLLTIMYLFFIFSYANVFSKAVVSEGFPMHLLLVPLPTHILTLVPTVLSSIVVSAFFLFWINFMSSLHLEWFIQFVICLLLTTIVSWTNSLNWSINTPVMQKAILIGLVFMFLAKYIRFLEAEESSILWSSFEVLGSIVLVVSGYLYSCFTLKRTRCGESSSLYAMLFKSRSIIKGVETKCELQTFHSNISAREWYEWKSLGWIVPRVIFAICLISSILAISFQPKYLIYGPIFTFVILMSCSQFFAQNKITSGEVKMLPHCATLPLSNFDLAFSKLLMLRKVLLSSVLILFVVMSIPIIIHYSDIIIKLWNSVEAVKIIALMLLFLIVVIGVLWAQISIFLALYWMDKRIITKLVLFSFVVFAIILMIKVMIITASSKTVLELSMALTNLDEFSLTIPIVSFAILVIIKLASLYFYIKYDSIKKLKSAASFFCLILFISLILLSQVNLPLNHYLVIALYFLNLSMLCMLPIVLTPISVYLNRHR